MARPAPSSSDAAGRDIYLVSLDPTAGHEQRGRRPILILSPERFNRITGTPLVVPITTSGGFVRNIGFAVSLSGAGTQTTGVVRCDQPRALDIQARAGRRVEALPAPLVDEVLAKVATLLD